MTIVEKSQTKKKKIVGTDTQKINKNMSDLLRFWTIIDIKS